MAKDPAEVARLWAQNLGRSTEKMRAGVMRVAEAPTQAAARQQDRYVEGVAEAARSGKWRKGLLAVSKEDWQQAMMEKGVRRVAEGATAAQGKMQDFLSELLPYTESVSQQIKQMPKGTLEDSKARAIRAIELMAQFKRRR